MFMTKYTGWVFYQPLSFYFINLLKENFLILFAIIGAILILKKPKDYKNLTILSIFLLFFIFFNSIAHKETRFILVFLPYMYIIASYGIFKTLDRIKKKRNLIYLLIIIVGILWLITEIPRIQIPSYKEYPEFTNYLKTNNIKDNIWTSNPIFISDSNKKADELIYYPSYNSKRIDALKEKLPQANHILIDTCDILPCSSADKNCPDKTTSLLNNLKNNFKTIHYKKEGSCEQFIFEIISSP